MELEPPTTAELVVAGLVLRDFVPSPALKACLAATESALAAVRSECEEAAKRLETAKAKHRDLLNSQVVCSRLAGARNIATSRPVRSCD